MYWKRTEKGLNRADLEAARLGFLGYLRRKRFSPQFVESHAEDLLAQACLEYSRKLAAGVEIENPPGFLIECAWRRTINKLEAEKSAPRVVSSEQTGPISDAADAVPEEILLDADRMRKVREAVQQLSLDERRLLGLSYFQGFTVREAGRQLHWHSSKAQRTHERARRKLQELLGVGSADDLELDVGVAAYASVAAEASTRGVGPLEQAAQGLASLRQQVSAAGEQLKQQSMSLYNRAVDPTPLAAARPGTVATVVAGCIALGGGATYCVEQGVNPIGAAGGLVATSSAPESPSTDQKASDSPAPVYTPEPSLPEKEAPPPEAAAAPEPAPEPKPDPKPQPTPAPEPEPSPEESFEPDSAYASSEGGTEETYEAPEAAPVESSEPAPAPARPGPQFGGP